jgi:ATP-dependent protease ClpP protease subunit
MIEITIDDEIAFWGISAAVVSEKLKSIAAGEEIKISINSPGGSINQSIAIFNIIRNYAKSHPVSVYILGEAASGASYIALAARTVIPESKVQVSDNSIFLIHNPYGYVRGDYKELSKRADWFQRLAFIMASVYANVSKQKHEDIQKAMDEETFYIGQEIVDAGFANYIEKIDPEENSDPQNKREVLIVNAKASIKNVMAKMAETKEPEDLEDAVALLEKTIINGEGMGAGPLTNIANETTGTHPDPQNKQAPDGGGSPAGKENPMTKEELKAKYPEVYAAIFNDGEASGIKKEQERAAAHLKLGEASGSLETAAKYIKDGSSVMSEAVQAEYLSLKVGKKALADRAADDPGSVVPGGEEELQDDAVAMKIFDAGYAGKEFKGGKK